MRNRRRFAGIFGVLVLASCRPHTAERPSVSHAALPMMFDSALSAEAHDPLAASGYLDAIDATLERWNDPWAAPVLAASLDALVWRRTAELPRNVDHAIVHRSRAAFIDVTARLRAAHSRAVDHPILGPMLAFSLHELALRTGAIPEAAAFRRQAGCVEQAVVIGPLAWPALSSLDAPLAIPTVGPLPARLPGVGPFGNEVAFEPSLADACALELGATGSNGGLRAIVVDVLQPKAGWVYAAVGARSPIRLDLGGETLVKRTLDTTEGTALGFGRAWVEAGRARLVLRIAPIEVGERVSLQLVDEHGVPIATVAPVAGEQAGTRASRASTIELVPEPHSREELITAASADLALGLDRRAGRRLDQPGALSAEPPTHVQLLRMRSWRAADELTGVTLDNILRSTAERAQTQCPDCWEARLAAAQSSLERAGAGSGTFAALVGLGVTRPRDSLRETKHSAPELAYLALTAHAANLKDVARNAYEELAVVSPGSALTADVDAVIHTRVGRELIEAACRGGTSRSAPSCLMALLETDNLDGAVAELERLRRLRGSPALFRKLELGQWLAHGHVERAARLYDALPLAERDTALLALLAPTDARQRLERDLLNLGDAPYGYEPLARMLGVVADPAPALEAEGVVLVAKDRADAFLPGAGTAVLRHIERYDVNARGLLFYWTYDLRRLSDTEDVASGAEADDPRVMGKWASRVLRRRIHKRDGRVLDPDPNAHGTQGHTDLSQLEKGDYVERIAIGWALPEEHGQLVVDGPDSMPPRTSVREGRIELRRPTSVPMKVWAHALLGEPVTEERDGIVTSTWRLANLAPRRLELDVPPLEAHVAVSFGTDDYSRIGRALGEHLRMRDEADPFVARFTAAALGPDATALDQEARVLRITAAVGKAVRIADPRALSDHVAAFSGDRGELAREILERGDGSRTWVVHRALREAGIESRIAVAETRPWSVAPNFPPHIGRFTHPLVLVRIGERHLWIDADVEGPPLPPGRVSPELRGRMSLLGDGSLVRVDGTSDEDADAIDIALELDEQGLAKGTFRAVIHGRAAQRIAGALETLVGEQRTNLLRSIALGWVPWADVRDVALSSDVGSWQIAISAEIAPSSFAEADDRKQSSWTLPGIEPFHSVLPRPRSSSLAARYTAQADRASTLAVDAPLYYRVHRTVTLPSGAKLGRPAPALDVTASGSSPFSARRSVTEKGRVLDESFEVNLPVHVVDPAEFEAFASRIRQVDEGFAFSTRAILVKK